MGVATRGNIIATGGSAGGTLMGVVANKSPGLFRAIVAKVPAADVLSKLEDRVSGGAEAHYDEHGDPNNPDEARQMSSYDPIQNVHEQEYVPMLVTVGFNDTRVYYYEPMKWVATLRHNNRGKNKILMRVHTGKGHFGNTALDAFVSETAFESAYILDQFGITE
jgi:oligopeptidase B